MVCHTEQKQIKNPEMLRDQISNSFFQIKSSEKKKKTKHKEDAENTHEKNF